MIKCVILIPAYKPEPILIQIVKELKSRGFENVVCVDDGSGMQYRQLFLKLQNDIGVTVLRHATNLGKGRSLKTGFNYITNNFHTSEVSSVITMDADGQHKVENVVDLYNGYNGETALVLGSRKFAGNNIRVPLRSKIGNIATKWIFNYLCNIDIADTQTGLRLYPFELLPRLMKVSGEGYEYETNCLLYCKEENINLEEREIETVYENNNATSHFNPLIDSVKIYAVIMKYTCASLVTVGVDYFVFFLMAYISKNVFVMTYSGRAVAAIFNFILNKKVVFKNVNVKPAKQVFRYLALLSISGTVSATAILIGQNICSFNILLLKAMVEIFLFFFNFYIQKNYVFEKETSYEKSSMN